MFTMRDDELAADLSLGAESTSPENQRDDAAAEAGLTDDVTWYQELHQTMKEPAQLHSPPPSLLDSINDEIDALEDDQTVTELTLAPAIPLPTKRTNSSPDAQRTNGSSQSDRVRKLTGSSTAENQSARRGGWLAAAAIAAICGTGLGFAGGYGAGKQNTAAPAPTATTTVPSSTPSNDPVKTVVAEAKLATLKDKKPRGSAQLVTSETGVKVVVSATDLPTTGSATSSGYLEVWLINSDLKRMVSIGILTKATAASFSVPQKLIDEGYVIVDISQEEFDDKPQHSGKTLARGGLNV